MTDATHNLRRLLNDYYSGRASDDMIREIVRLFSELPVTPPDLLVDQQIFMACDKLPETLPPAPDRLTQLIEQTVDSCQGKQRRNRLIMFRWIAASGAVAALIALLISIGGDIGKSGQTPVSQADQQQLTSMESKNGTHIENEPAPQTDTKTGSKPSPQLVAQANNRPPERASSGKQAHKAASASASNHKITDPVEAARRLDAVFDMIENNINRSAKIQSEAFDALNIANEKVSSILNNSLQ